MDTEEVVTTPQRHPVYGRMKKYYPEKEYEDDASMLDDIDGKLGEFESYQQENEAMNQKFIDAIESDPELKEFVVDVVNNGTSTRVAAAKIWGPEDLEAQEGDPDYADVQAAHESRMKRKEEDKAFLEEVRTNISQSQEAIQSFADDNKMDEEERLSFVNDMTSVLQDAFKGKVSPEFMAMIYTARNHTKEVDKAVENAKIEGRNENIQATIDSEQENMTGDGVPEITSGTAEIKVEEKKIPTTGGRFLKGTGIV